MHIDEKRGGDAGTRLALHAAALVQQTIGQADVKIATVSGVVCGLATFLAGQLPEVSRLGQAGAGRLGVGVLMTAVALIGLIGAMWQLGDGFRPRLDPRRTAGRMSIAALASDPPSAQPPEDEADCWRLVRTLAQIAVTKHQRVRHSLAWTALSMTGMAGIVLCTSLPSGIAFGAAA
jgi:hypothetical protein